VKDTSLIYELTEEIRQSVNDLNSEQDDDSILHMIQKKVLNDQRTKSLSILGKSELADNVFNSLRKKLDFLEKYLEDPEISEIMVNGCDVIFIERNGKIQRVEKKFPGSSELEEVIRRIASKVHREINEMNPILDARLEDGSRVHAVYRNIAIDGPVLNIRKFPKKRIAMKDLIDMGSITEEAAGFLKKLVVSGYNCFISGGTSSGKTTFLNCLSDFIPKDQRVIVIEDSAELDLGNIENLVRMETRNANIQGRGEINMRDLIKASLRMRPDRIIVGEVRGGEVIDMISAMNTGHSGSLSTGHANSAEGMISRLETLFLTASSFPVDAVRGQIESAIDIIVHMGRLPDGSRKVMEISELTGISDGKIQLNTLYEYDFTADEGKGMLVPTENHMINTFRLGIAGYSQQNEKGGATV